MAVPTVTAGQTIPDPSVPARIRLKGVGKVGLGDPPITQYAWQMLTWPQGSTINQGNNGDYQNGLIISPTQTLPICYLDVLGTYTFQFLAHNADGNSAPAVVTVEANMSGGLGLVGLACGLPTYDTATLPPAGSQGFPFLIYNSDTDSVWWSDGTTWHDFGPALSPFILAAGELHVVGGAATWLVPPIGFTDPPVYSGVGLYGVALVVADPTASILCQTQIPSGVYLHQSGPAAVGIYPLMAETYTGAVVAGGMVGAPIAADIADALIIAVKTTP